MKNQRWYRVFQILCLVAVLGIALGMTQIQITPEIAFLLEYPYDKILHISTYSVLTVLAWWGTGGKWPVPLAVGLILLAGVEEFHQSFVPGRSVDFMDFIAGAVPVALICSLLSARKRMIKAQAQSD